MTAQLLTLIPLAILGMIGGASFSAVDAALLAVSRSALEHALEDQPERLRRRVLHQHDDAPRTLAAIGLARVISESVMAVAITAIIFETLDGWTLPTLLSIGIAVIGSFLVVSVSPRTVGTRHPEKVSIALSGLISVIRRVVGPVSTLLIHIGSAFTPGGKVAGGPFAGEAELRRQVDRATENEELERDERDMIQGVFDLGDTSVREIMVPRTDVVAISADTSAEKAMRLFVRSGYSRIPVIGESVDDLLGVLYVKDVMRTIHSPWDPRPDRAVVEIMRQPMFVPEFVGADDVLRQMQTTRVHIAIIVDEYGGVSGMVTIEDVLEEIVGEIADEHDRKEPEVEDLGEGIFRVPARESVDDVGELFGLDIEDEDVDTIGGLLGKALGRIPIVGSEADVLGLHLEAERTAGRRKQLATLLVRRDLSAQHGSTEDTSTGTVGAVTPDEENDD
jgi:CBS domain containing-hemolysin-like protein